MTPVFPLKSDKYWDYTRFQREFLSQISNVLHRVDLTRKTSEKEVNFSEITTNIGDVHTLINRFRSKLEREFGTIADSQIYTAVIGQGMGYGEFREVYYHYFREYEDLVAATEILRAKNYRFSWESPPDTLSSISFAGHYLIIGELIQLGQVILEKFTSYLLEQENLAKEFFYRLLIRDVKLEHALREQGIVNRWFEYTRHPPLVSPFDVIIPLSNLRDREREILFAVRMAFLLTKGMGEPVNFYKNVYKGFYFINNLDLFNKMLAEAVFEKFRYIALKRDIQNVVYSNFQDSWSFKPPENLVSLVFSYVKGKFGDIDELISLIDKITLDCLEKLDITEPRELKSALTSSVASAKSILRYLNSSVSREQVKGILERYFSIVNQILEIVRKEQHEFVKITRERLRDERKKSLPFIVTEKLDDLNQKLDLIPILFGGPTRNLASSKISSNCLTTDETVLIARGSTYLAYDALAHLNESSKDKIQRFLYNYLIREADQIKELDRDVDLQDFIKAEIKLISEILLVEESYLGSLSTLWQNYNPKQDIKGIITQKIAKLLVEWVLLPKKVLSDENSAFTGSKFVNACRRGDLRNFLFLSLVRYLDLEDYNGAWNELKNNFPSRIIPSKMTLFADALVVKERINRFKLKQAKIFH